MSCRELPEIGRNERRGGAAGSYQEVAKNEVRGGTAGSSCELPINGRIWGKVIDAVRC